ncbi:MAG TPA: hypothetical protein VGM84_19810 [Steroidobacteraceae bacterium]
MRAKYLAVLIAGVASGLPLLANAGPFADDLGKCLVTSTTSEDRTALVQWIFVAAAKHPAVSSMVHVTQEQVDSANKTTAALLMKLLTQSCKSEAQKAIQNEGPQTIQVSFAVLGQVAGRELFASPQVAGATAGLAKYIDGKALQAALKPPGAPSAGAPETGK